MQRHLNEVLTKIVRLFIFPHAGQTCLLISQFPSRYTFVINTLWFVISSLWFVIAIQLEDKEDFPICIIMLPVPPNRLLRNRSLRAY